VFFVVVAVMGIETRKWKIYSRK